MNDETVGRALNPTYMYGMPYHRVPSEQEVAAIVRAERAEQSEREAWREYEKLRRILSANYTPNHRLMRNRVKKMARRTVEFGRRETRWFIMGVLVPVVLALIAPEAK